ncbi:MAG: sigma-70 family RNA polymerase sigma factor [Planctomycetes bacterium]|nr:sigma-70 family RNA polymerase sigma factor [Planctomycetota bacterium]
MAAELPGDVTRLLQQAGAGDRRALTALMDRVYAELHRIAERSMRGERGDHTLQPTALVNEAWLRLVGRDVDWESRRHFFATAATAMRRILVDHARRHRAHRRGRGARPVPLDAAGTVADVEQLAEVRPDQLLAIDEALARLAEHDARKARVVELRFFAGLNHDEIAATLGVSRATVERDWAFARAWLHRQIAEPDDGS